MVNINAMRAIVKHNVFKQSKQLSKSDQTKINDFIHSLSLNELKKKGLASEIIRILDMAKGKPFNERENAIQEHEEQLRQILEDELKAKIEYELAQLRTKQAQEFTSLNIA